MRNSTRIQPSSVYSALAGIPEGKVATYGDIAKIIGRPKPPEL